MAPLNAAFLPSTQNAKIAGLLSFTSEGHALGYLPSPVDRSHLTGQSFFSVRPLAVPPPSYDLRSTGKVTPVRDQGSCGDCWAFATYGSLESNLLTAETWDFSENNLKNTHGFDWGPCDGGNGDMSTAYLARWSDPNFESGPVNESDDPYNPSSGISPAGLTVRKHVQEVLVIPDRSGSLDNDNIKQAIMAHGALYTTMYYNDPYYHTATKAFYYSGVNDGCGGNSYDSTNGRCYSNHAVTVVGWDDNFPAGSFSPVASGNGAFIIKNSWGTSWGDHGYFYISYFDSNIGTSNYVFDGAQPVTNYSREYQYDPLGWTSSLGYGDNTGWFANIFTATASEQLSAVSFHTASVNSSYEIDIYTDPASGPTGGTLAGSTTGTITSPGYHTVVLGAPVTITSGRKFSVVVKLVTPGYNYPIPVEVPYSGYSSGAAASSGQSFMSHNGTNWSDVTTFYSGTNVCLKAFTSTADTTPPPAPVNLAATPATWTKANSFSVNWTNPSDPSGIAGAYYKLGAAPTSATDGTYTTSRPISLAASAEGGQTIYVWLRDGSGNANHLNRSSTVLYYDGTAPADGALSAAPGNTQVSLSWSGFSDTGGSSLSTSNTYAVVRSTGTYPGSKCTTGTQVYLGNGTAWTDSGLTNGTTYYYRACARDSAGNVSVGASSSATPLPTIVITTIPPGGQIIVDATPYISPQAFTWTPGSNHGVGVSSPQAGVAGTQYVFSSWSDGGSQSHAITTPASSSSYTAAFTTQYQLTTSVNPSGAGGITPDCSGGCWYNSGASAGMNATPGSGYVFSSWSGDCSGTSLTASATMSMPRTCTANFSACASQPVRIAGSPYASVQTAYDTATDGETMEIDILAMSLSELLSFGHDVSVTLRGGYDCGFNSNAGSSIIQGSLTISSGTVIMENVVLQ